MRTVALDDSQISRLKRVGFWWSDDEPELPHPRDYVDQAWDPSERDRVLSYLKRCYRLTRFSCGWSWCRFGCESRAEMGDGECTDGVWLFPQGFLHYVQHHAVKPPPDFLEHMRKMNFRVPKPTRGRLVTNSFGRFPRRKPLPWSLDPPTTPGSYWFLPESSSTAFIVDVSEVNGALMFCRDEDDQPLQNCKGQWQGPIPPPLGREVKPRSLLPKGKG